MSCCHYNIMYFMDHFFSLSFRERVIRDLFLDRTQQATTNPRPAKPRCCSPSSPRAISRCRSHCWSATTERSSSLHDGGWRGGRRRHRRDDGGGGDIRVAIVARDSSFPGGWVEGISYRLLLLLRLRTFFFGRCLLLLLLLLRVIVVAVAVIVVGGRRRTPDRIRDGRSRNPRRRIPLPLREIFDTLPVEPRRLRRSVRGHGISECNRGRGRRRRRRQRPRPRRPRRRAEEDGRGSVPRAESRGDAAGEVAAGVLRPVADHPAVGERTRECP